MVGSLREFLKTFYKASNCLKIPLPKPKVEIGSSKSNTIFLLNTKTISVNIQIDKLVHRSDSETTNLASLPSKSLNYTAINFFLQKMSNLTIAKFTSATRTHITLQTSVRYLRAITMCSAFIPDCGYDKSTNNLIGDVYCPNTECSGNFCLHKKTFQALGRSDQQSPKCASVLQVRTISFEDQTNSFFLSFGELVYIFEERPKSIQDVIGDDFFPGKYCFNREKCKSLDDYVTTPRSIYGCGKSRAWLFVNEVPFTLQEHEKATNTDKTRLFFAKKYEIFTRLTIVHWYFSSINRT